MKAFFLLLGVLLPAMLAGLRTVNIGTDTGGYPLDVFFTVRVLNSLPAALDWIAGDVEDLYVAIAYFCSHLIDSFNFFLFVISLITIGLLIGGVFVERGSYLACHTLVLSLLQHFAQCSATSHGTFGMRIMRSPA